MPFIYHLCQAIVYRPQHAPKSWATGASTKPLAMNASCGELFRDERVSYAPTETARASPVYDARLVCRPVSDSVCPRSRTFFRHQHQVQRPQYPKPSPSRWHLVFPVTRVTQTLIDRSEMKTVGPVTGVELSTGILLYRATTSARTEIAGLRASRVGPTCR